MFPALLKGKINYLQSSLIESLPNVLNFKILDGDMRTKFCVAELRFLRPFPFIHLLICFGSRVLFELHALIEIDSFT